MRCTSLPLGHPLLRILYFNKFVSDIDTRAQVGDNVGYSDDAHDEDAPSPSTAPEGAWYSPTPDATTDPTPVVEVQVGRLRRCAAFLWRNRRVEGAVLVLAGVLGVGGVGGWYLRDRMVEPAQAPLITVERPVAAVNVPDSSVASPNVLGLKPDNARQVLVDAGVPAADIITTEVPAAGEPGRVVSQNPQSGIPVTGKVTLGISTPAVVPKLAGSASDDARIQLADLGARVSVIALFVDGTPEGTVISSEPAEGAPLGPDIKLVVAAAPSSVFLEQLKPMSGGCSTVEVQVNGAVLPSSLSCSPSSLSSGTTANEPEEVTYLLNRRIGRFEATLGQDDKATPGAVLKVVVRLDGKVLNETTVAHGESKAIAVPTAGGLQLSLELSTVANSTPKSAQVILGSARLVGGPDDINALLKP